MYTLNILVQNKDDSEFQIISPIIPKTGETFTFVEKDEYSYYDVLNVNYIFEENREPLIEIYVSFHADPPY